MRNLKVHRRVAEIAERTLFSFDPPKKLADRKGGKCKTISLRQKIYMQQIYLKANIQFLLIGNHEIRRSDMCFARRA